ncbi:hypothetical protein LEP1GSC163_0867 [Leptospira santarosai str. CBC379]|nr:hypothetical protein LEP1GSC163_0867 [Leptospira santarosai str. CBC379]
MDRSSSLRKEPTLSLRGFWLSRSLWIAHLRYAKTNAFASRLLAISLSMESLIFATQRPTLSLRGFSATLRYSMDRSSSLRKEPTLSLRGFWLSRSLWIAHLRYAKNQRFRFAAFGYLALYGSLIFATQRTNAFASRLLAISLSMDRSSSLRKEPTLSLRGFWLSRSLWIAR